jgi:hypoxanthine phosphoribosyltransferase
MGFRIMDNIEAYALSHPSYNAIQQACKDVFMKTMIREEWGIDYIIGLSRGGLIPATVLSHMSELPLVPVKYSSKSGNGNNKNHDNILPSIPVLFESGVGPGMELPTLLIVDDISDSGKTLREVVDHYTRSGHTVYSAALYYKELATPVIEPDVFWRSISEDGPWIIFPWEREY